MITLHPLQPSYLEHWSNSIMFTQHPTAVDQVTLKCILIMGEKLSKIGTNDERQISTSVNQTRAQQKFSMPRILLRISLILSRWTMRHDFLFLDLVSKQEMEIKNKTK